MEKLDGILSKVEAAFDRWLTEFESHPIRSGIKVLLVIWVLRFIKRQLL